ncbi:MAG: RNB domain-containing ribonuclease, partial [Thermodesulfobacteriota bacterium]
MVQVGQVVEFIDHNQFVLGVCLETKNDRPRILTQQNREMNLSSRRLVGLPGPTLPLNLTRTEIINRLKQLDEKRHELARSVDLAELWSLLAEAAEEELVSPEFAAGLIFGGPIQSDQVSALLRAVIDDKIYFRFRGEGLEITPADQLERLQAQKAREEQLVREKEAVSAWLAQVWTLESPPPPTPPPTEKLVDQLIDVAVNGPDSPIYPVVKGYLESAGLTGAKAAFDILVKLGTFTPDEDLDIRRCKLPVEFPALVLQETAALTAQPKPESLPLSVWADRVDLTGEAIFTLDGPSTNDFDDALSVSATDQGLTVSIHITDVGYELKPGTAL